MIIYGEYLFVENYIVTFLLLFLTARLMGRNLKFLRLNVGATLGALYSFVIFLNMTPLLSVLVRIMGGGLCIAAALGVKNLVRTTALYYLLSFATGGIVMAMFLWIQEPIISHQGIMYIEAVTYTKILAFGIISFAFLYWFIKLVRCKEIGSSVKGDVRIKVEDKTYIFRAFVDSGNYLKDPLSGQPVLLIDEKGASILPKALKSSEVRYGIVPFRSVGTEHGFLESIRVDEIIYQGKIVKNGRLAFYKGNFGDYEVLMSRDFLEGGVF